MHKLDPQNFQTHYTSIFVKALHSFGLKHVIISPGSRNTPLTLAFAAHPDIEKHIAIDERSAAFMALGIGMQSGLPAALVCTSGTAPANYYPAIIEASMSGIPMIVLSADRGFDESNTGANQWIDQSNLYGNKAVFYAQAIIRPGYEQDISRLNFLAKQTWLSSVESRGCSHINFPFSKPLEPDSSFLYGLKSFYLSNKDETTQIPDSKLALWSLPTTIFESISKSKRPIIVCGSGCSKSPLSDVLQLFSSSNIPILSEAGTVKSTFNENLIFGFNAYLRNTDTCTSLNPDLIIRIGGEPVGNGLLNYLKRYSDVPVIHFYDRDQWSNSALADEFRIVIPHGVKVNSNAVDITHPLSSTWLDSWKSYEKRFLSYQNNWKYNATEFRDGDIHKILSENLSPDEIVMVSNSFAARDIDLFGMPALKNHIIFMNRGASGIDGITSTALGIALASKKRVTLITGDLAFIHDLSALVTIVNQHNLQLRIVVINNNGGQIFRMLPVFSNTDYFTDYFETPQNINIVDIATSLGILSFKASNHLELVQSLQTSEPITIVECITDPIASMKLRSELWD